uniref:Fungal lipase-type domain-containing protein n=1 Tax=Fagus sylvatica TaxID=28930 RepID=A0A2N9FYN1_FAGSY
MFQDTKDDPNLIVVAFRGTHPFDPVALRTDVDLSWSELEGVGMVHSGFMKALGLQKDKGWPNEIEQGNNQKQFAYYEIRQRLRDLLQKNDKAKFILTGHSLGAALAVLFLTMLAKHDEKWLMEKLEGVYTFGQPRVGDKKMGNYMKEKLEKYKMSFYLRSRIRTTSQCLMGHLQIPECCLGADPEFHYPIYDGAGVQRRKLSVGGGVAKIVKSYLTIVSSPIWSVETGGWSRVTVAFGLGFGFHFSSVCSLTVSGLGFSGGFWVDGGWSRGSGLAWVFIPWVTGGAVGLGSSPVGHRWVLGFGAAVGLPWVWGCRGSAVGLPWGCRGFGNRSTRSSIRNPRKLTPDKTAQPVRPSVRP